MLAERFPAVLFDNFVAHKPFEVVSLHLVESPVIEFVLVVDLGRFLRQHLTALFGALRAPLSLLLVPPGAELLLHAVEAVVQVQHHEQHYQADEDVTNRSERDQDLVEQHDDKGTENRTLRLANTANREHGKTQQDGVEPKNREGHPPIVCGVKAADKAKSYRSDEKDRYPGAAIVNAGCFGEGLALFRRHAQDAPEALAVDKPE